MNEQSWEIGGDLHDNLIAGRDIRHATYDNRITNVSLGVQTQGRTCPTNREGIEPGAEPGCGGLLQKTSVAFNQGSLGFMAKTEWAYEARPPIAPAANPHLPPKERPPGSVTNWQKAALATTTAMVGLLTWWLASFGGSWAWAWAILIGTPGWIMVARLAYFDEWDENYLVTGAAVFAFGSTLIPAPLPVPLTAALLAAAWALTMYVVVRVGAARNLKNYEDLRLHHERYQAAVADYRRERRKWEESWICTACGRKWRITYRAT